MKKILLNSLISATMISSGLLASNTYAKKFTSVMVTDTGGIGDKSFNDGAYAGLKMAHSKLGVTINVTQSKAQSDFVTNLSGAADDGNNFILGVGYLMGDAIQEVAANYPKSQFVIVDSDTSSTKLKNLSGITYRTEEVGYLAGIVAGNMTYKYSSKSKKLNRKKVVGAVLGMDIPPVETYVAGFIAGVHSVDPKIKVLTTTIGSFSDPSKGKAATDALISKGTDIVFPLAGSAGLGAISSAKQHHILAIGVDQDQNAVAPNTILTSAMKNITTSVYQAIAISYKGKALPKSLNVGLKDKGVGLAPYHSFSKIVPKAVQNQVALATKKIIAGKIHIPTSVKEARKK